MAFVSASARPAPRVFPFSAIVGQNQAKLAMTLALIDPGMGGVLLSGVKGTAKSTLVRALPGIVPPFRVRSGCRYHCNADSTRNLCEDCARGRGDPVDFQPSIVTVPLGTTEDSLLGSIDMEKLLRDGTVRFEAGLLGDANNQILYVDEVNLLPDSIADDLLDACASGWNTVERESVSVTHPAGFTLVGTMNPEEGRLRPQLLDRFALSVGIGTITDPEQRTEIISRSLSFSANPEAFAAAFTRHDESLKSRISTARRRLDQVKIRLVTLWTVAGAMASLELDGQRPDIVTLRAARALAALEGAPAIELDHLVRVAPMTVMHRTRGGGFSQPPGEEDVADALHRAAIAGEKKEGAQTAWAWDRCLEIGKR